MDKILVRVAVNGILEGIELGQYESGDYWVKYGDKLLITKHLMTAIAIMESFVVEAMTHARRFI